MNFLAKLSLFDLLVLILCGGNLYLVIFAVLKRESDSEDEQDTFKTRIVLLIPGAVSQILYLFLFFAWRYRWIRFYPGNPAELHAIYMGILLSAASVFSGLLGKGLRRMVSAVVGVSTGLLWLLALMVSSAV